MEDKPIIPRNDVSIGDMRIASENLSAADILSLMEEVLKNKSFSEYLGMIKIKKRLNGYTG